METRNPQQLLQFALNHERGQETQRAINTQMKGPSPITYNQMSYIAPNQRNQAYNQTTSHTHTKLPTTTQHHHPKSMQTMWNTTHSRTLANMPSQENPMQLLQKNWTLKQSVPISKILWQTQQITPQQNTPQSRRVRNTRATTRNQHTPIPNQDTQQDNNDETADLKNTFFIQEVFESWKTVNFIKQ